MNYRHAFHAGNHADVLKHVVLLAMVEAFKRKSTPFFALDTHAGRGRYLLQGEHSDKTGEARAGIFRLMVLGKLPPAVQRSLKAVQSDNPVGALMA
jgi:23S rRNA (adenine2030-N6)-methyltransferase